MIRILTQVDVLKFVYNECSEKEEQKVKNALLTNENSMDEFVALSEGKALLNECSYSASPKTIDNILAYAQSKLNTTV